MKDYTLSKCLLSEQIDEYSTAVLMLRCILLPYAIAFGAALPQRRIANAMPTNPAAMQPSQTGALEAADDAFHEVECAAELGAR